MGSCTSSPHDLSRPHKRRPVSFRPTARKIQNAAVVDETNDSTHDVNSATLDEKYIVSDRVLGEGADGRIYEGSHVVTGEKVALKVITFSESSRSSPCEERRRKFRKELQILGMTKHRGVVRCLDFNEDEHRGVLVLEFAEGGDLFDRLKALHRLSERHAREALVHIAEAVWYLHSLDIVHRDLKPENILLKSKTSLKEILIADFGYAAIMNEDELMKDLLGSLHYVAPEILLKRPYGKSVDIWALGVILFIMLTGSFPFRRDDNTQLFRSIVRCEFSLGKDHEVWTQMSDEAKDLLHNLLVVDPSRRYNISQVMLHPWITCYKESDCDEEECSNIYSSEASDTTTDYASVPRLPEAARAALLL